MALVAEARSWSLFQLPYVGGRSQCYLTQAISRKQGSDTDQPPTKGWQHCRQKLYLPRHNTSLMTFSLIATQRFLQFMLLQITYIPHMIVKV